VGGDLLAPQLTNPLFSGCLFVVIAQQQFSVWRMQSTIFINSIPLKVKRRN